MFPPNKEKMAASSMILLESAFHQNFFLGTLGSDEVDDVLKILLFVENNVAIGFPPIKFLPFVFSAASVTLICSVVSVITT